MRTQRCARAEMREGAQDGEVEERDAQQGLARSSVGKYVWQHEHCCIVRIDSSSHLIPSTNIAHLPTTAASPLLSCHHPIPAAAAAACTSIQQLNSSAAYIRLACLLLRLITGTATESDCCTARSPKQKSSCVGV